MADVKRRRLPNGWRWKKPEIPRSLPVATNGMIEVWGDGSYVAVCAAGVTILVPMSVVYAASDRGERMQGDG